MSIIQGSTIDRKALAELIKREERRFVEEHPRSLELFTQAKANLLGGVPMNWMVRWVGAFPLFVVQAEGAHFIHLAERLARRVPVQCNPEARIRCQQIRQLRQPGVSDV